MWTQGWSKADPRPIQDLSQALICRNVWLVSESKSLVPGDNFLCSQSVSHRDYALPNKPDPSFSAIVQARRLN